MADDGINKVGRGKEGDLTYTNKVGMGEMGYGINKVGMGEVGYGINKVGMGEVGYGINKVG